MRTACVALAVVVGMVLPAAAQQIEQAPPPAFEVASIRPVSFRDENHVRSLTEGAPSCGFWRFTPAANRFYQGAVTLCMLMRMAYDVTDVQIAGLPEWSNQNTRSAWYEVEGRAAEGTTLTVEQTRAMLRTLLADRFKLTVHREPKSTPVYALTVDKQGHKLSSEPTGVCPSAKLSMFAGPGTLTSCRPEMSISQLVFALNREVDRPVVDRTNLTGRYAFALKWSPDALASTGTAPSIFTAVREQLGLRLEPSTELVDALVIDHVEPPSAN
jgi:uncharacterized protein (TIGR03435 family)